MVCNDAAQRRLPIDSDRWPPDFATSFLNFVSQPTKSTVTDVESRSQVAYLSGIDTLQESSQRIFDEEVDHVSVTRATAILCGLIGTLGFLVLDGGSHYRAVSGILRRQLFRR